MLKKTITYTNPFTEQEASEEHYFHISKADLIEMEMEEHSNSYVDKDGKTLTGMQAKLQRIVDSQDGKAIMFELKDIIRRSYGKKEGDRFLKSTEIWESFSSTEAYSQLLFDLCTNAAAAAEFMNGIIPHNLEQIAAEVRAQAEQAQANGDGTQSTMTQGPAQITSEKRTQRQHEVASATSDNPVTLTRAEVTEMDSDELKSGLATGRYKLS